MPNDVYNLGRASGLSAWEIYVRQSLILNPDVEPLSEREWLAETIGIGTSMLLKIKADTVNGVHYRDFPLPSNSLLCAPNTVIGSFFFGEGTSDNSDGWCNRVTDYGAGIANNDASSPADGSTSAHAVPVQPLDNTPSELNQRRMMEYIRIQDAIVLQDGVWSDSETSAPKKTFVPDITKPATLRVIFQDRVTEDFFVLFTGFSTRAIIKGETGFDMGAVMPDDPAEIPAYRPENGNFLGPRLYPWANKVVFTYPAILTYLLRQNFISDSNNLKITADKDSTRTIADFSAIKAGPGVQVNDPSTEDDRAKEITISSRIAVVTGNRYLKVEEQTANNTHNAEGDSSSISTRLKGSVAKPGKGIAISQPTEQGGDHIISSIINISKAEGGYNDKYLGVHQVEKNDATSPTTTLTPSYALPRAGIGLTQPANAGDPFYIGAKIETGGNGRNYIKITQDKKDSADEAATILTPSRAIAGRGVGITQPDVAGGDFTISAIIHTAGEGSNYIGITQANNSLRSGTEVSTELHPSKIAAGKGVGVTQPTTAGKEIKISSLIDTKGNASNYIKVEQSAHDSTTDSSGAGAIGTSLTPSKIVGGKRLSVTQPNSPGAAITINTKLEFEAGDGIGITDDPYQGDGSNNSGKVQISSIIGTTGGGAKGISINQTRGTVQTPTTTIKLSELVVKDSRIADVLFIKYGASPGDDIEFYIDLDALFKKFMEMGPFKKFIDSLLDKIYGGGELNEDGSIKWPSESANIKIPLCDLNIYSKDGEGEVYTDALRGRKGNTPNDLRMK